MGDITRLVSDIIRLLLRLGGAVLEAVQGIELSLRNQLSVSGIPTSFQTIILVAAAVVMILLAVRIFGGLLRFAAIVILALLAIKFLMPNWILPSQ